MTLKGIVPLSGTHHDCACAARYQKSSLPKQQAQGGAPGHRRKRCDLDDLACAFALLASVGHAKGQGVLNMMNVPLEAVHAYARQAATIRALRQGEANMTDAGSPIYPPNREAWRKEGLVPVLQRAIFNPTAPFRKALLIQTFRRCARPSANSIRKL